MQEWISSILARQTINGYNLVTLIPQYSESVTVVPPFSNSMLEYVVFVGYDPRKHEYVVGRIWEHTVARGLYEWDNGSYFSTLFRNKTDGSVFGDAMAKAITASRF